MKIRDPDLSNDPLQKEHAEVGLPQLEAGTFQGEKHPFLRSEERRVGKECRSRWSPYH